MADVPGSALCLSAMTKTDLIATLRQALPQIRSEWPVRSLAIFGSRTRNDARADSDLDVLVDFASPIALSSDLTLEDRLAAITGLTIDPVSDGALKPHVGERVRAETIRI